MPYYRVTYEYYVEGEYASADEAKEALMTLMQDASLDDLSVEEYDAEAERWL